MNYQSRSKAKNKIIKLAVLALLLVAIPLTVNQVKEAQLYKSQAKGGIPCKFAEFMERASPGLVLLMDAILP